MQDVKINEGGTNDPPSYEKQVINELSQKIDERDQQISRLRRDRENEQGAKMLWIGLFFLLLAVIACKGFRTIEWRPNFESNSIVCFGSSWWGLKKQVVRCEWRRDADPDRVPNEGWCTKYLDKKWHIFYFEEGDELVLSWPTQDR